MTSILVSLGCLLVGGLWGRFFYSSHKGADYVFFDPQDAVESCGQKERQYPKSASNATFEPLLKHYIGVTQLLITVAAASIAFGGSGNATRITAVAKLILAWSVFYGVLFCALLLWRYDEYGQDVTSYKRKWYSAVESLGFACLSCFVVGYLVWAVGLGK